jgi:hypothetical protein
MKKTKIMLIAITVLAAVGGALAFKAKTFNQFKIYSCVDGNTCSWDVPLGFATLGDRKYDSPAKLSNENLDGADCDLVHCTFNTLFYQPE